MTEPTNVESPERVRRCTYCGCNPITEPCRMGGGEECGWHNLQVPCCSNPSCVWRLTNDVKRGGWAIRRDKRAMLGKIAEMDRVDRIARRELRARGWRKPRKKKGRVA